MKCLLKNKIIRDRFAFSCCQTCVQGSFIDESITIFDYNRYHAKCNRKWLWTAITRAVNINDIYFFKYKSDDTDLNKNIRLNYFNRKIQQYKNQDKTAKRTINKHNYINVEWFEKNINNHCQKPGCGCDFTIDIDGGVVKCNLTAQRLNNDEDHNLNNIIPFCRYCNCSSK